MALTLPKLAVDRKQVLTIAGGAIAVAAAGWFGWQYYEESSAPPPKPQPAAAKAGPAKPVAPAAPAPEKVIADVLAASGLDQHVNQLPQQLAAGMKQPGARPAKASPAVLAAIEKAMTDSFTAQRFRDRLNTDLKKNFDQKRMQTLLGEFSKPETKKMIELERASAAPEELAKFARSQAANKLSPPRKELITRIDAATHAGDLAVEAAFASMKELAAGIAGGSAKQAAAVDKVIEKQRASATAGIRNATFSNLAFTFRDTSDPELEGYAKFCETENYKWFSNVVYTSLLDAAKEAAGEAGSQIGALAKKPGKPATAEAKPAAAEAKAAPARTKPAAAEAAPARSKSGGDARACLDQASDAGIINCAEKFR
ncbi:MAG: hypothetical protein NT123_13275 [Proteobacteria bacterium]|nr:hypothetical protein [Pseudomonadota bacterium]